MSTERVDHAATAQHANQEAMRRGFWSSWRWHRKAQVHATLALVEEQRTANLVALAAHYAHFAPSAPEGRDLMERVVVRLGLRERAS